MSGRIPSRGSDQFNLRFPEGMRDRLKVAAADNNRSLNAEIISRIEQSLEDELTVNQMIASYYWLRQITSNLAAAVNRDSPTHAVDVETLNMLLHEMDESFKKSVDAIQQSEPKDAE